MKKFKKVYVEIGNICNLNCVFCPKTKRKPQSMRLENFRYVADCILPYTDYIYLHIMGEPLINPEIEEIISYCNIIGLKVCITTNGTLIGKKGDMLIKNAVHKVSVSLHSFEGNEESVNMEGYIGGIIDFAKKSGNTICSMRLWNINGAEDENERIFNMLENAFEIEKGYLKEFFKHKNSFCFGEKVYLELAEKFEWPEVNGKELGESGFCYGLRDQMGILVDGGVVPCCLDHEGDIRLGNIFEERLEDILGGERALGIYNGFSNRNVVEELCKKCGYRTRF